MSSLPALEAAAGVSVQLDADRDWRVEWNGEDWLGPLGFALRLHGALYAAGAAAVPAENQPVVRVHATLAPFAGSDDLGAYRGLQMSWEPDPLPARTSVRAYAARAAVVFRIEATEAISAAGSGQFAHPWVAWPVFFPSRRLSGAASAAMRSYGHQYSEFALPVFGNAHCTGFAFAPHRPPVVEPLLLIGAGGHTLLLAPLDQFHEQVIAVPPDAERIGDGVQCGWHGDLVQIPAGFATELILWAAPSPRAALAAWADVLLARHQTRRPSRYSDALLARLSYWTDNGAVYYYRTEPDCDYTTTLERVVADLHRREVPVGSVQIDSWFYPHEQLRPVSPDGAPLVPPSGLMTWEPRADLFPHGFRDLQRRLGGLPLAFHSRHFSSRSPYFEYHPVWRDGSLAHPAGAALYDRFMAQAASWGAITYEQDWMIESFLGVRGLREAPGRARAWQEALDHAAGEHGLSLQWCMATPADFMQTVSLHHLASIRTSGDYRYLFDNGLNWVWFLHTNALARALGLQPFKDVFLSHGATERSAGEPYADIEALLAGLSTGPVGIGDELGQTNRDVVMRTCREDGVLIKPDVPIAAIDRCFSANGFVEPSLLVGETYSSHPAGRWVYVASFNAWSGKQALAGHVALSQLGAVRPQQPVLAYDWRARTWQRLEPDGGWKVNLGFQDWDYRILCPLLPGEVTVFGDVSKYATVGDRRVASITATGGRVEFNVLGVPHSLVEVSGYAAARLRAVTAWVPGYGRALEEPAGGEGWLWDNATGRWAVHLRMGPNGYTHVTLALS